MLKDIFASLMPTMLKLDDVVRNKDGRFDSWID
jgi:hypothetical protein